MSSPEHRDRGAARRGRVRVLQGDLTPAHGPLAHPAGGPHYLLRPSVEPFVGRDGVLYILRPGDSDLLVREPDHADIALVRRLAVAPGTTDELMGSLRTSGIEIDAGALQSKLDSLIDADVVVRRPVPSRSALADEDRDRFSRQLPYLSEFGDPETLQLGLRRASVAVLGCGGLGAWAIAALACLGVGHLILVDDDTVELSNLNRQILYRQRDVGASKVQAAAGWVHAFDPAIRVTKVVRRIGSEADLHPLVAGTDAVVLAADSPPYEIGRWVNAACIAARVPFIVAGQVPPVIKVGPTYLPGGGPCFACHETALRLGSPVYDDYVAYRQSAPAIASTVGPASCVAGGIMGLELMHVLTGNRPATQDFALIIHMRTLETRREPVRRQPDCVACKDLG